MPRSLVLLFSIVIAGFLGGCVEVVPTDSEAVETEAMTAQELRGGCLDRCLNHCQGGPGGLVFCTQECRLICPGANARVETCGENTVCGAGTYCCDPYCGTCAPDGYACILGCPSDDPIAR
jgi:hypothetical protein